MLQKPWGMLPLLSKKLSPSCWCQLLAVFFLSFNSKLCLCWTLKCILLFWIWLALCLHLKLIIRSVLWVFNVIQKSLEKYWKAMKCYIVCLVFCGFFFTMNSKYNPSWVWVMFHLTFSFSILWVIDDWGFWVSLKHLWLTLLEQRGGIQLDRVKKLFNNWNLLSFLTVSCILLTIFPFFFSLAVNSSLLNRTMVLSDFELVSPSSELVSSPWEGRDHMDGSVLWCHSAGKLWIMRRKKWSLMDHICVWGKKVKTQSNNPF